MSFTKAFRKVTGQFIDVFRNKYKDTPYTEELIKEYPPAVVKVTNPEWAVRAVVRHLQSKHARGFKVECGIYQMLDGSGSSCVDDLIDDLDVLKEAIRSGEFPWSFLVHDDSMFQQLLESSGNRVCANLTFGEFANGGSYSPLDNEV